MSAYHWDISITLVFYKIALMKKIVGSKVFEKSIFILIVLNLIAMVIESEQNLRPAFQEFLSVFEIFSILSWEHASIEELLKDG